MTKFVTPENNKKAMFPVFPVPIYINRLTDDKEFNRELVRKVEILRNSDPEGVEICKIPHYGQMNFRLTVHLGLIFEAWHPDIRQAEIDGLQMFFHKRAEWLRRCQPGGRSAVATEAENGTD